MAYRLSALAEQDLEEIWFYVAEDASPATADRLIDTIFDRFELLVQQPRMGRNRPEFGEGATQVVDSNCLIKLIRGRALLYSDFALDSLFRWQSVKLKSKKH